MKKLILLIIIPALLLTLSGCFVASTRLEIPQEAAKLELRSGKDGGMVEITDSESIGRVTGNISALRFEKVNTDRTYDGWSYELTWLGPDGSPLDSMTIISGNRVRYNDAYYDSLGATIDTVFLDELLEGG